MISPSDASEQDGESRSGLLPGLPEHVHLLGAGGAGVSGLARLLHARGHRLSGHDREASPFTAMLEELGVPISLGESDAAHMPIPGAGVDAEGAVVRPVGAVIRSAAIGDGDPQLKRA